MVVVKVAQPLLAIAAGHPDRQTRRIAIETLAHLPLAPAAAQLAEPIAAELLEMPDDRELLESFRGRRVRAASATVRVPAAYRRHKDLEARLLERPFNGSRVNASSVELRLLGGMPKRNAGRILVAGLRQLGSGGHDPKRIGNALVELAVALPKPLDLPLDEVLDIGEIIDHVPRGTLAWALSRAGGEALARQLGPRLRDGSEDDRQRLLPWMRDIAINLGVERPSLPEEARMGRGGGGRGLSAIFSMAKNSAATAVRSSASEAPRSSLTFADVRMFPQIACDAHPLAGSELEIAVSLAGSEQEGVMGEVYLPPGFHRLRVHLQFGQISQWSECSAGKDTEEPAYFKVPVPQVEGERALLLLRVNFYLNERWCGEGERNLDVRAREEVPRLKIIPKPQDAAWANGLVIEPGAQPADLIVRIQRKSSVGEYLWICLSPHLKLPQRSLDDSSMALGEDVETYVRNLFRPHADKKLSEVKIADIEGAGELIYEATPKAFKDAYWAVWRAAEAGGFPFESIQFVTDEPYIPWELMRVGDSVRAAEVDAEILAVRHSVGRWLSIESARLSQRIRVRKVAVAASDYEQSSRDPRPRRLPWASEEKAILKQIYSAREVPLVSGELTAFLARGGAQVLHFACHGAMYVKDAMSSSLITEDAEDLTARMVHRQEVRRGIGGDRPLVFLNACEVGGSAIALSLVAGFPNAFLYAGAAAVVSPLWVVADETAMKVAKEFYGAVLSAPPKATLGSVMRDIRGRWAKEGNLTYLAYVLYGDPLARIAYEAPTTGVPA